MLKLFKDSLIKAKYNIVKIKNIVLPMNISIRDVSRQSIDINECQLRLDEENYNKLKRLLNNNKIVFLEDHNYRYLIRNGIIKLETSESTIEFNNKKILKDMNGETCIRFNSKKYYVVFLIADKIGLSKIF